MRVNVYAEELPEVGSIEIISKEIEGRNFTGLRIPLYLPVTLPDGTQVRGKFMHHADDDDSSAITIWGKRDLRGLLREALAKLDAHYAQARPLTVTVSADNTALEQALAQLQALPNFDSLSKPLQHLFSLSGFVDKLFCVESDSLPASAGELRVRLKPTDCFERLLVACRAGNLNAVFVEHGISPFEG